MVSLVYSCESIQKIQVPDAEFLKQRKNVDWVKEKHTLFLCEDSQLFEVCSPQPKKNPHFFFVIQIVHFEDWISFWVIALSFETKKIPFSSKDSLNFTGASI